MRDTVVDAPVFTPTVEEFRDPIAYIESIEAEGYATGIIKILPPKGWTRPTVQINGDVRWPTSRQSIHRLQEGACGEYPARTRSPAPAPHPPCASMR